MKSGKAMGSTTTTMALARKVSPLDPFPFDVMTELGSEGNEWACRPGACGRGVTSSPSEMFVRYCVSRYPRGLDAVLDGLVRLGVIMPRDPEGYVARVAKEMNEPVPDAFQVGTPHRPGSCATRGCGACGALTTRCVMRTASSGRGTCVIS